MTSALNDRSAQSEQVEPIEPAAWILAGGLGTRIKDAVPDRPKVLAPVGEHPFDRPFLAILLDQLARAGFRRVLLLLGNQHAQVTAFVRDQRARIERDLAIAESIEPKPLGTAGAIKHAEARCEGTFFVFNGDTFCDVDARALLRTHRETRAAVTIAATQVDDAGRFNRIELGDDGLVRAFREKEPAAGPGLINAGIYVMEPAVLRDLASDRAVSLEREVFPALLAAGHRIAAVPQTGAFFDIGTPESYRSFSTYWAAAGAPPRRG